MSKELFIAAHEQLIAEYMEEHPDADESRVYDLMADRAFDRMRENLADRIDAARDAAKERGAVSTTNNVSTAAQPERKA